VSLKFYIDENVDRAIALGLRRRGGDVLTVQEDGNAGIDDIAVLERAASLGRVVFSNDMDMVEEAVRRQRDSEPFLGVTLSSDSRSAVASTNWS
jgi:predicted nuclease of predicted toxin-antitoxin system